MTSDIIICIHQGEDGAVCGKPDLRPMTDGYSMRHALWVRPGHPFAPGRKCPTCDGTQRHEHNVGTHTTGSHPCPSCADSPVMGYLEVK